jgi:DNA polymerase-3 subunit delta
MAKSAAKSGVINALDYFGDPAKHALGRVCSVCGDEAFLKAEVLAAIRRQVLSGEDSDFAFHTFAGRDVQLRDVLDALATVSLFGHGRRLVVVEDADGFVSQYRGELEDYVSKPTRNAVLVLEVNAWPSNTRLAKAVSATGLAIECTPPKERQLKTWLVQRAKTVHQVRLDAAAADALCELVPPELGILVQEVSKLALMTSEDRMINVQLVRENVGGWRARTTWEMIDAVADGRAANALAQLGRWPRRCEGSPLRHSSSNKPRPRRDACRCGMHSPRLECYPSNFPTPNGSSAKSAGHGQHSLRVGC